MAQPVTTEEESCCPGADEYGHLISMITYEGNLLWTVFGTFLIAEAVLVGFLGSAITRQENLVNWSPPCSRGRAWAC